MEFSQQLALFSYLCCLNVFLIVFITVVAVLQFKKKYPEKSYVIGLLNTILYPLRKLKLGPFKYGEWTLDNSLKLISEETGLTDYGELKFKEAYYATEKGPVFQRCKMTNLGQVVFQMEFQMTLTRRLKAVEYLKSHPEILDVKIKSPVFVFGLGRSGTTFTHHLLSLDPNVRSPKLWELIYPTPEFNDKAYSYKDSLPLHTIDREVRAKRLRDRLKIRSILGQDGMENIHAVGADLPEECLHAMCDEMPCGINHLFAALVNWDIFIQHSREKGDIIRAYEWYKKLLQILQYQQGDLDGEKRWVLKSPIHILFLPELKKIFPDAKLVW
jgi:hypothetical protein